MFFSSPPEALPSLRFLFFRLAGGDFSLARDKDNIAKGNQSIKPAAHLRSFTCPASPRSMDRATTMFEIWPERLRRRRRSSRPPQG